MENKVTNKVEAGAEAEAYCFNCHHSEMVADIVYNRNGTDCPVCGGAMGLFPIANEKEKE